MSSQSDIENRESQRADFKSDGEVAQSQMSESSLFIQLLPGGVALFFVFVVMLAFMLGERAMMSSARQTTQDTMQVVLTNTRQYFDNWSVQKETDVKIWAQTDLIISVAREMSQFSDLQDINHQNSHEIRDTLDPWVASHGYQGFSLISNDGLVVASMRNAELGQPTIALDSIDFERLNSQGSILTRPFIVDQLDNAYDAISSELVEEIAILAIAPIMDGDIRLGYFALRLDAMNEYSAIFQTGRTGLSGETYAVDETGRLVSESRFVDQLFAYGLIAEGHSAMQHIDVRDPGVNLQAGGEADGVFSSWPLTVAARGVIAKEDGEDLNGYRDYRGVLVVGAWVWDEDRNLGIITEVGISEAFTGAKQAAAVLRGFAVAMAVSFIFLTILFTMHRNISQQRAKATQETKTRLSQILMTAAEGIYGLDGDGVITFINSYACKLLGYKEDELIGRSMHALVHHSHQDGSVFPKEECPIHTANVPLPENDKDVFWTKNGESIPIEYACSAIDPISNQSGAVVVFRDISGRIRDEMALRRYSQELKRSNAELQEFAYAASHDLQEPLRKIQAFGERLNNKYRDDLEEGGQHYLDRMVDAASRMRRLIDDLLGYSRVNSRTTSMRPVELSSVLADVVSDLEPRIVATGASVKITDLPAIEADQAQMHQLFLNLLANALKFHRPDVKPSISVAGSVEVSEDGAMAKIAVTDNGIGFDMRHSDRIFGMFERLHGRNTFDGTGVGLATCRKIAERHGGSLTAWGETDAGSVFTLTLPVRQANLT